MPDNRSTGWLVKVKDSEELRSGLFAVVAATRDHAMSLVADLVGATSEGVEIVRMLADGEVRGMKPGHAKEYAQ
jgi:hypothetical protein